METASKIVEMIPNDLFKLVLIILLLIVILLGTIVVYFIKQFFAGIRVDLTDLKDSIQKLKDSVQELFEVTKTHQEKHDAQEKLTDNLQLDIRELRGTVTVKYPRK